MTWSRKYLYIDLSSDEKRNKRTIVESLIALHRMREEKFIDTRYFCIIASINWATKEKVYSIGFFDNKPDEIFPGSIFPIPSDILEVVKSIVNKED